MSTTIEWVCEVCGKPIAGDSGALFVRSDELRHAQDVDRKNKKYERSTRKKAKAEAKAAGKEFHGMIRNLGEWLDNTEDYDAPWHTMHHTCDPTPDDASYWISIDRISDWQAVAAWAAHLDEKRWFKFTNWHAVMRSHLGNRVFV